MLSVITVEIEREREKHRNFRVCTLRTHLISTRKRKHGSTQQNNMKWKHTDVEEHSSRLSRKKLTKIFESAALFFREIFLSSLQHCVAHQHVPCVYSDKCRLVRAFSARYEGAMQKTEPREKIHVYIENSKLSAKTTIWGIYCVLNKQPIGPNICLHGLYDKL